MNENSFICMDPPAGRRTGFCQERQRWVLIFHAVSGGAEIFYTISPVHKYAGIPPGMNGYFF